ncbi:hypothetical protein [Priestia megaterium]|uniref:hypothetical protein n=1 Tax=Priestia megaterium TaxID=1404 RepID=UPI00366D141C
MKATGVSTDSQGSTSSVEGESASLHDEIQAFGQSGSTNGGSSSVGKASAPLHEEIQTSGYGGSTSESSSSVKCKLPYTNKRTFCFHADRDGSSTIGGYTGTSPSKTTN